MAASTSSPSGFSYAQAARGQTSTTTAQQAASSKVTSGTTTPATSTFSELGPSSNWADDVESTVGDKKEDAKKASQEQNKPAQAKDTVVERTKSESRIPNGTSGVSSPDLTATPSTNTSTDESSSSAANGTASDTTWETKSQNSEPAWIAERKERQSSSHTDEQQKGKRGKKDSKEAKDAKESEEPQPPPKPVVLHDAPPPAVNPWAKRMEDAKTKVSTTPTAPAHKAAIPAPSTPNENQRPRADSRRKANSVASVAREADSQVGADAKKQGGSQGKRALRNDVQGSKPATEDAASNAPSKAIQREHQSLPNLTSVPPPVKDEVSWPTPENAQEKERKEASVEKDLKENDDSGDAESTNGTKVHQKTKWKPIAVTPSIVWETEEMNRPPRGQNGERGGRGGNGARGRSGFRGTPGAPKGSDRAATKSGAPSSESENPSGHRGRSDAMDRESMPPPQKPTRQSSLNGSHESKRTREQRSAERSLQAKSNGSVLTEGPTSTVSDARRTKSPSKVDSSFEGDKIPEPISRQSATNGTTMASENGREGNEALRDGATVRRVPSDGKKEARSFEGFNGAPRGSKRNGRGRGGSREYTNGHQVNSTVANGHSDLNANPYGVPPSPSPTTYQTSRGQFNFAQQGRGGWSRGGNARSQSIPVENGYAGRSYWPGQQLPPMQTYYPGMYDYNGVPMSAIPYNPMMDPQYLLDMVTTQLDYYFSIDNLLKDMFLRKNMDSKGFVFLDVIANFNRIKQLTTDKDLLKVGCTRSGQIEYIIGEDGKDRLRKKEGWEQFLVSMDQRELSAQTEGPSVLQRPEPPVLQLYPPPMAFRGPPSAGLPSSQRRSYDSGYPMNGAVPHFSPFSPLAEGAYADVPNGEEMRGRAAKSPIRDNSISPAQAATEHFLDSEDQEPDVFDNEHLSTLTVLVKMKPQHSSHHHAASRTFSNGSIDTRSIYSELDKPADESPSSNPAEATVNGDGVHSNSSRLPSPSLGRSPEKDNTGPEIFWVRGKELPQDNLPQGTTLENYLTLRDKALGQRREAATGTCPYDLDVLYQFWSHFLIRNFNRKVYGEFKFHAHDDAQSRHSAVGLQNLVQFYAQALSSTIPIRDSIVKDYVELVKAEPTILQGAARKQLRQAWRNGALNLKNRKKLADIVDDTLRQQLES